MEHEIKLIIFDMDGVLVDACEWHKQALNEALKSTCDYTISEEDHYSIFNGLPTRIKLNKLSDMGVVPVGKHQEINDLKQEKTIEIINRSASYDSSKVRLFSWLESKNIKIACYTNSIRDTATLMLKRSGVYDMLDYFVTSQDVTNPKPNPEGYISVLKHFNIDPLSTIIVEDSPKGLQAAKGSGCKVMQVNNATEVNIENIRRFINESFNTHGG
jgi:beta-phosphoglucomutase